MSNKDKIEDIFDEVDKVKSAQNTAKKVSSQNINTPPPQQANVTVNNTKSKVPFMVLLVFIFLVIVGMIYLVVTGTFLETVEKSSDTVVNTVTDVVDEVTDVVNNTNTDLNINLEEVDNGPLDTDGDGLSDEKEIELGTSTSLVDSDNDGLFDKEEVDVYKSNPLKSDSDNDGVIDGTEVDNGYDPNGPDLLLDLQKEIDNL